MNYNSTGVVSRILLLFGAMLSFLSCNESLPVYEPPRDVLALTVSQVEQMNDRIAPPGRQAVHIVIDGENIHDEVFLDSVHITGSVRIWWKRRPLRSITIPLDQRNLVNPNLVQNGKMLLLPGQKFSLDFFWNMRSEDSVYLPNEMNFAYLIRRTCGIGIACADPEEFVVETSLLVYERLGILPAPPKEFTFIAKTNVP